MHVLKRPLPGRYGLCRTCLRPVAIVQGRLVLHFLPRWWPEVCLGSWATHHWTLEIRVADALP